MEIEQLQKLCHQLVPQILAQRGWALVQNQVAFITEVLTETQARQVHMAPAQRSRRPVEKIIEDAVVNRYSHLLYAACADNGAPRQCQAFEELHRYLYPIALYRAKHDQQIAEESAQEALVSVWQNLGQVKDPGSFPRWAGVIVTNCVNHKLANLSRQRWEISETDLQRDDPEEGEGVGRLALTAADEVKSTNDARIGLEIAIRKCLRRSWQQQAVIISLFFEQKSFKEIADELGQKIANLHLLKTRALARLRKCQDFLAAIEGALG